MELDTTTLIKYIGLVDSPHSTNSKLEIWKQGSHRENRKRSVFVSGGKIAYFGSVRAVEQSLVYLLCLLAASIV